MRPSEGFLVGGFGIRVVCVWHNDIPGIVDWTQDDVSYSSPVTHTCILLCADLYIIYDCASVQAYLRMCFSVSVCEIVFVFEDGCTSNACVPSYHLSSPTTLYSNWVHEYRSELFSWTIIYVPRVEFTSYQNVFKTTF